MKATQHYPSKFRSGYKLGPTSSLNNEGGHPVLQFLIIWMQALLCHLDVWHRTGPRNLSYIAFFFFFFYDLTDLITSTDLASLVFLVFFLFLFFLIILLLFFECEKEKLYSNIGAGASPRLW